MEKKTLFFLAMFVLIASLFLTGSAQACPNRPCTCGRTIDPIVSTQWLDDAINGDGPAEDLVIIDIRIPPDYQPAHIPGSINEPFVLDATATGCPFSNWIICRDDLWLEIPNKDALFGTIGSLGINDNSKVVIVTGPLPGQPPIYASANATRVALTLIYAGVKNVAILDGGYPKWKAEYRTTTVEVPEVTAVDYRGKMNNAIIVSRQCVKKRIWKADIIDARDADVYYGATIEPFALDAGHIRSAKCLPTPWMWEVDPSGTYYSYKDTELLRELAQSVIGNPWHWKRHLGQEIIVYCGVGGYASSWWFVLTQVLGYDNVKLYDGSAQEWVMKYKMIPYQWD